MQISVEESSTLERRLTVEVPEERIAEQVKARLVDMRKSARIDGFRQGKAPLTVVKQRFGKRIRDEIVGEILQSSFGEAMSKQELRPAGQPVIDPVSSEPGSGLTYTATFEIFPEFELKPLDQVEITRETCEIGDADIDTMIEKLREQNKEWIAVERGAQDGDQLQINFAGSIDGEPFEGGSGEDFDLALGTGMMIDGFEAGLTGKMGGESADLNLMFPDDYGNKDLAGKAVRFIIDINKVSEAVLPEINQAFIDKFGVSGGDLPAFRDEVRANMEKERERALRQRFNNNVMEKIAGANDFEVPTAMVEAEAGRLRQQVAQELIMRGMNPGDSKDEFESAVRVRAKGRVKLGLIMAEIVKQAELAANPDKVRQMIENMASSYEDSAAVVKWYYDNPEQLQQVEALCLEEDAVNWIAEQAKITEVSMAFDALMNPVQTGQQLEATP
jgi:trigger factor